MLFMDNKIFPDECYPYAHDYLPVYTEIISFDGFEKSLCAWQKHLCLCNLIFTVHAVIVDWIVDMHLLI